MELQVGERLWGDEGEVAEGGTEAVTGGHTLPALTAQPRAPVGLSAEGGGRVQTPPVAPPPSPLPRPLPVSALVRGRGAPRFPYHVGHGHHGFGTS